MFTGNKNKEMLLGAAVCFDIVYYWFILVYKFSFSEQGDAATCWEMLLSSALKPFYVLNF